MFLFGGQYAHAAVCAINLQTQNDDAGLHNYWQATKFTITDTCYITDAKIQLKKLGTPPATIALSVEADIAGSPTNTPLETATLPSSSVGGSVFGYVDFVFTGTTQLTAGTYWLVSPKDGSSGQEFDVGLNSGASGYWFFSVGGAVWSDGGETMPFEVDGASTTSGGGGGGSSTTPTSVYDCVKDGTSSDCLVQVVDNPTEDYAAGVLMFMGSAVFMIWVFRRRSV